MGESAKREGCGESETGETENCDRRFNFAKLNLNSSLQAMHRSRHGSLSMSTPRETTGKNNLLEQVSYYVHSRS